MPLMLGWRGAKKDEQRAPRPCDDKATGGYGPASSCPSDDIVEAEVRPAAAQKARDINGPVALVVKKYVYTYSSPRPNRPSNGP